MAAAMPTDHPSVTGYVSAPDKLAGRPILDPTLEPPPSRDRVAGIDVSHYQDPVDWTQLSAAGVKFAFIKATEGQVDPDPCFQKHWDDAGKAGILTGAYHFLRPSTTGAAQAQLFLQTVGDRYASDQALPPVLDVEVAGLKEAEILAWLNAVRAQLKWTPLIYTNFQIAKMYAFQPATVGAFPLWWAQYPLQFLSDGRPHDPRHLAEQKTWKTWAFWQYSETGRVSGVSSRFADLNVFNGSWDDFVAWRGRQKT
jgi:lysozyme